MSVADLEPFRYGRVTGAPEGVVAQINGAAIECYPRHLSQINSWMRCDFRGWNGARKQKSSGWKAHLSVDPKDLGMAWDAILPVLAEETLLAKIIVPSEARKVTRPEHRQAGKTLVVYGLMTDTPKDWHRRLTAIETRLRQQGVRPGWHVRGDYPVPGSIYAGMRHDKTPSGQYSSGIDAFNPFGARFANSRLRISVPLDEPLANHDTAKAGLRLLEFIAPSWQFKGPHALWQGNDVQESIDLARVLKAHGLPVTRQDQMVKLDWIDTPTLERVWHGAMEVLRCVTIARIILGIIPDNNVGLSITPRASLDLAPSLNLQFSDLGYARTLVDHWKELEVFDPEIIDQGNPLVSISYAGRFHTIHGFDPHWAHTIRTVTTTALENLPSRTSKSL